LNKHPGKKKIEAASLSGQTVSDAKLRFTKARLSFLLRKLNGNVSHKLKSKFAHHKTTKSPK